MSGRGKVLQPTNTIFYGSLRRDDDLRFHNPSELVWSTGSPASSSSRPLQGVDPRSTCAEAVESTGQDRIGGSPTTLRRHRSFAAGADVGTGHVCHVDRDNALLSIGHRSVACCVHSLEVVRLESARLRTATDGSGHRARRHRATVDEVGGHLGHVDDKDRGRGCSDFWSPG